MLLLLNGPPGVGKSTVAARYVDDHPLALNLDIDVLRAQLGRWQEDAARAGVLARALALSAARTHLLAGHDVVVPQFVARAEFIDQLAALAREVGVDFVEVVLLDTKENSLRRFQARDDTSKAADPQELSTMYDRLAALIATRPWTRPVPVAEGEVEETYTRLLASLT
ncbi:AAA family ATPase [Kutzneria kofuensis]|uniref:Putative kinase n=1 Tax=Kutzneria kofuensis TaxID=103725 RepID=A0A7W9KKS6_9PSEU|nr:AAA family ATPase [Kutzneria kofuensis]MBB5894371.1 putative kinase [Kutzneria kofuensis]